MSTRFSRSKTWLCLLLVASMAFAATALYAQNTVSGELTGTVTDPTGAVVANVMITLKNPATGFTQSTASSQSGFFRFALLTPGVYSVHAAPPGFSAISYNHAVVSLGQVTNVALQLSVAGQAETVEVSAEQPLLQAENANVTANFSQEQMSLIPVPGNDMTNYALTAPGVTLSTGAGYGNFSAYGLPGTSNLFTVNGSDDNDPFNGLNNSGASNNTLGINELQEMTIVTNGYSAQYGRSAGANINYSTKSGSNSFHGNGEWEWNGSYLNANDWFNDQSKTPRPFANSNTWMGSIGGPIKKDKLFFFYDNEGLRYVLPSSSAAFVPSPQFETATLANISANQAAELPYYQNMFKLYNGASNIGLAKPVTTADDPQLGCGDFSGAAPGGGTFGVDTPCALQFRGGGSNKNTERLMAGKVDWIASGKDKLSFRYWQDRGLQATYTDPINPVFNATSAQPQDQGQMNYTRVINNNMVNQFIMAGSHYSAIFDNSNRAGALAAYPTTLIMLDGLFNLLGGEDYAFPQGRKVTQFQFVDDFSWTRGNHNLKFGANIRRNLITDLTPFRNTTGELELGSMTSLYNGLAGPGDTLVQRYDTHLEAGFSLYSLGLYAQDEWRVSSKLKLTLSLRADRNSNESCKQGCFTRPAGPFAAAAASVPYNQTILSNLSSAFPGVEKVVWEPRVGFAYSLFGNKTVLRGGGGLFSDLYPAQLAEPFASNPPFTTSFNIHGGPGGTPIAFGVSGNLNSIGTASDQALLAGFAAGQTEAQIAAAVKAAGGTFSLPAITAAPSTFNNPKYAQWNFEVEQALGAKTALTLNYVGSHGYDLLLVNPTINEFCVKAGCLGGAVPSAAPDSRFGRVVQYTNNAVSNYHGVTASLSSHFTKGFSGSLSYTYSHSLDSMSNGGLDPYTLYYGSGTPTSILAQINPANPRAQNYGNSDYDFRRAFNANYLWQLPFKPSNALLNAIVGGWSVAGTFFARSGMPYTPYFGSTTKFLKNTQSNANFLFGDFVGGKLASCDHPDVTTGVGTCLTASQFTVGNDFGNYSRNAFRGPKYFNTDMTIIKKFKLTESGAAFSFGANFYNILNHPNFLPPVPNMALGNFGQINTTATPPSSPYGNFQGAAVSGRIIQTVLKFEF
jgi:hypothetical protein